MDRLPERLDALLAKQNAVLAIDGGSASGKTTLAAQLQKRYGCTVVHMDDFFLQPHQRTPARYREPGGNVDRERFLTEVLEPLKAGKTIAYRRFDCATQTLLPAVELIPGKLTVVEGAYSMHPDLRGFYDLSVFKTVTPELQRERIIRRNTPAQAELFFTKWILLENAYFEAFSIPEACDLVL